MSWHLYIEETRGERRRLDGAKAANKQGCRDAIWEPWVTKTNKQTKKKLPSHNEETEKVHSKHLTIIKEARGSIWEVWAAREPFD